MIYEYKTLDSKLGLIQSRVCFAKNEEELKRIVKTTETELISIKQKSFFNISNSLDNESFTLPFFINMHTLISNNINLVNALKIVLDSFSKLEHKAIIQYLLYRISEGLSLHLAMQEISELNVFDKITIKTIQIAEQTATLQNAFSYLIDYLSDITKTKKMLKGSMAYPSILLIVILSVMSFWVFFIIPTFAESFTEMGMTVPSMILTLSNFQDFIAEHTALVVSTILSGIAIVYYYRGTILVRIPIIKNIKRNLRILRFFNSMSLMLGENVIFLEALAFSLESDDINFDKAILQIISQIKKGSNVSLAFSNSGLFTHQEISIIQAGEQAGDMTSVFKILANTLQKNVENIINKAQNIIQPIATVIVGLILLIMVCSVFLPIYDQLETYI